MLVAARCAQGQGGWEWGWGGDLLDSRPGKGYHYVRIYKDRLDYIVIYKTVVIFGGTGRYASVEEEEEEEDEGERRGGGGEGVGLPRVGRRTAFPLSAIHDDAKFDALLPPASLAV